jgi:DNA-directed RNA polymerase specialized sigma24 family protein
MAESGRLFPSTHWSAVLSVRARDEKAGESMNRLCATYYYPVYAMIRKRGHSPEDAQDLTQDFFHQMIGGNFFGNVTPSRGRFRYFLVASIKNFLVNEWDKSKALKRGAQFEFVSMNEEAEGRYQVEPPDTLTPDQLFDQHCALAVLERSMKIVRQEFESEGKGALFDALKEFAVGESAEGFCAVAGRLQSSEGAVRVAVHRLRKRIAEAVRVVIRDTVETHEQVDEELRQLKLILQSAH